MFARKIHCPPVLLAAAGFLIYLLTLAPTITGTDAGELALAAYSSGVAHAPGFPTWLLAAWPFTRLPWGEPAWGLNIFSALSTAGALAVVWFWLQALPRPEARGEPRRWAFLPVPAAVLALAVGRSIWPWATTTEVYALNLLLAALALLFLFRWSSAPASTPFLPLAALFYGLALGAHLATTALLAPAILLWLLWHRQKLSLRLFIASALALGVGISIYAVLPLRAAGAPLLNWGDPDTPYRFWRHLTAAQYRSNLTLTPASLVTEMRFGLGLTFWQYGPLGLPLILWGLQWGWREQRRLTAMLLVGVLCSAAYAVLYAIEDDQEAYYILAHLLLLVPLRWGLARGWEGGRSHPDRRSLAKGKRSRKQPPAPPARPAPGLLLLLAALTPVLALLLNRPLADRSQYWYHRDYYRNLTAEVAPGGTIFTRDWQFYSPSLYYQHVLGDRPDLRVIDVELMRRDWYLDHLARWYPDLMQAAAGAMAEYRQLRDAWERDPAAFQRDANRVDALQNAFLTAVNALIKAADERGDVHISPDQEQGIAAGYNWTPAGLTFRLDAAPPPALPPLQWDLSHLAGRWPQLPDEPARKVARAHALMAQNRAIYLDRAGDRAGANAALTLAQNLVPN